MDEATKKLLYRIKTSDDGNDFLDYLIKLSQDNYQSWKQEGGDVHRGIAIAYDRLLDSFNKSANQ